MLKAFLPRVSNKQVMSQIDNTTTMIYIKKTSKDKLCTSIQRRSTPFALGYQAQSKHHSQACSRDAPSTCRCHKQASVNLEWQLDNVQEVLYFAGGECHNGTSLLPISTTDAPIHKQVAMSRIDGGGVLHGMGRKISVRISTNTKNNLQTENGDDCYSHSAS